jgi:N6-adenosine-specific RNA methylase IME4
MKYDVILADPPWTFSVWNAEKSDRHTSHKYDLMSTEQICSLPVKQITADNCALFLWATWPNILNAFDVITSWGFTYRTLAWEWVKAKRNSMGFHFGMGYYTRSNPEPCLLAVKGTTKVAVHDVQALIYSPVRQHSRKPDEQYRKIERLYPNRVYLEMFARRRRLGWDAFGNEIENSVIIA